MKGDRYQCAKCLKWFKKTHTDQEVQKEFNANFPDDDIKEGVTLCEECYKLTQNDNEIASYIICDGVYVLKGVYD